MKVVIISGLSGAGKTHAADWFEDHGYYCIDNMPPALIKSFLDLAMFRTIRMTKAAFVVDIRSDEFFSGLNETIDYLRMREDIEFSILFIEASDSTLIRRYNETRRNHPLSTGRTSKEVIEKERSMLADLRARANHVLDTTNLKVAQFNLEMSKLYNPDGDLSSAFAINVISFGFKYGIPQETDMVFDVRFIPNPYYVESLKHLTGNNKKVQRYVLRHEIAQKFIEQLTVMIDTIVPCYVKEGKNHLNIAFGCTGGQHRSVTLANEMARIFREEGYRVTLEHREL
ncbi:RNase adaptor protein RapZ [Hornefia porci]|uniref:RNase adaptor protein RapZ n=2 Tax=Hornefia porci TaxID=2652292 RepID=A0A1Q9JLF8_9FIRM|nr:RNase adaptor protein RapZ [Hornefia porci]